MKNLVSVLCATNRPWDLDEAILRRFEKRIYIQLPNENEREQLFRLKTKGIEIDKNLDFNNLARMTSGCSSKEIVDICRDVSLLHFRIALRHNKDKKIEDIVNNDEFKNEIKTPITIDDFRTVFNSVTCRGMVDPKIFKMLDDWIKEFPSV